MTLAYIREGVKTIIESLDSMNIGKARKEAIELLENLETLPLEAIYFSCEAKKMLKIYREHQDAKDKN
jgi:hypothetical protein